MQEILFTDGKFQYFRIGGLGFIQFNSMNAEFSTFDPFSPNDNWIKSHAWPRTEVIKFASTIKFLGLEGKVDE